MALPAPRQGEAVLRWLALASSDQPTAAPLPEGIGIRLSAPRPNPFKRESQFVLTLARGGAIELAIYDLGGRRIATLHHGELAAGAHPFVWNGRGNSGARARDGVYLIRAEGVGSSTARKLVQLRGE